MDKNASQRTNTNESISVETHLNRVDNHLHKAKAPETVIKNLESVQDFIKSKEMHTETGSWLSMRKTAMTLVHYMSIIDAPKDVREAMYKIHDFLMGNTPVASIPIYVDGLGIRKDTA